MATYGYTTVGTLQVGIGIGGVYGIRWTPASNVSVSDIRANCIQNSGNYGDDAFKAIIYDVSSPYDNLGVGPEVIITTTQAWKTSTFSSAVNLTGGNEYFIGIISKGNTAGVFRTNPNTSYMLYRNISDNNYSSPAATLQITSTLSSDVSIYATYTATASAAQLSKVNGLALTAIAKYQGIAKAAISKINGLTIQ
jgi:hypothetical protein